MHLDKTTRPMFITFIAPALVLYLVFMIIPGIQAFYISLFDWNGFSAEKVFIGFGNFKELILDKYFWNNVMKNTLLIVIVGGALTFFVALFLGGLLSRKDVFAKNFLKNLIFFPTLINPVAIAILWGYVYSPANGLLNGVLSFLGVVNLPNWTGPGNLLWAVLAAMVWMYSGYYFIILYSALERIPSELIEAAEIEGCNQIQIFFNIKVPLILDLIQITVVLWCINAVKEFALLYAWGGGIDIPSAELQNLATYMQFIAFGKRVAVYRLGYATTMGVIILILTILFVVGTNKIFKKQDLEF